MAEFRSWSDTALQQFTEALDNRGISHRVKGIRVTSDDPAAVVLAEEFGLTLVKEKRKK